MILVLLLAALFLRLLVSPFGTLALDQNTFIAWSNILARSGFASFYHGWSDYLPGYLYILWVLGKINLSGILPQFLLYKLPAIFADIATGFLIYKILSKSKGVKWGIIGAAVYLFNPAVFANSAMWGQADSLTALTSVAAVYFMPGNYLLSAIFLSVGTLVKPQVAFIFPVILFLMLRNKWRIAKILSYGITSLAVFIAGFIPFWDHGNFISFLNERLGVSLNQYPYTSVNAFNFWGLAGFWKPDNIYFQTGGYVLVLTLLVFLLVKLWKVKNPEYYVLSFVFGASFVFFTRMHERHLLPVFAPLAIAAIENPYLLIPYIGFSLTYLANLHYGYTYVTNNFRPAFPDFVIKFFEVVNIGLVVFIFYVLAKNLSIGWQTVKRFLNSFVRGRTAGEHKLPKIGLSARGARLILFGILFFAFITRIFDLSSPRAEYFDEVYHAFTAKVMMHADANKAWEWWNAPPTGFAYEWTHPPVAKLGMVLGMKVFGENSFGWRIPGALLGVGSVLLVYLLAKELFSARGGPASGGNDEAVALLSAGIFSLDGLALVMSRIGMNDTYILFFSLLSIYLFMKEKDFFSAVAFGLAIASKWSAIWTIPILGVLWLWRKNLPAGGQGKFTKSILWFFVLPFVIYLASYTQMFLTGHNLSIWWEMQKQMWWYHTGLKATHPYSSPWWEWPFLVRPIYLYTSNEIGGMVSRIYAMGNPLVFWFGLMSVAISAIYAYIERNKKLGLVIFGYLIFFTPWALSPRIMFLYHYLPSIPFLAIAAGYVLRRNPKLIFGYLFICLLVFFYFYPHWAGLQVPLWLDKSYYWISSWR